MRVSTYTITGILIVFLSSETSTVSCSYFERLRGAYSQAKEYLSVGLDGVVKLAEALHTLEDFIDATIDEECEPLSCPKGMELELKPDFLSTSNGCGTFGFEWHEEKLPVKEQKQCCNDHDHCYNICGADKDLCDLQFKKCLYGICKKEDLITSELSLKACKAAAKLMYTGTLALGCKAYKIAQEEACQCVPMSGRRDEL